MIYMNNELSLEGWAKAFAAVLSTTDKDVTIVVNNNTKETEK